MFKAAQIHMKNRSDNGVSIGPLKRSPQTYWIDIYLIQILFFISCTSITIVDAYSCLNVASVVLGGLSGAILTEISRLTAEDCYILDRQLELWAQHHGWCTGQVGSEAFETYRCLSKPTRYRWLIPFSRSWEHSGGFSASNHPVKT